MNLLNLYNKISISLLLVLLSVSVRANPIDSLYIARFPRIYSLKLFVDSRNTEFSLRPSTQIDSIRSKTIVYAPNLSYSIGVAATYKFFGLSLSLRIPNSNRDESKYGKTLYRDLQIHMYRPKIGAVAYYKMYKGFYNQLPRNILPNWNRGDAMPIRPDIYMRNIGADAFYVFNDKKFSLRAAYRQTEKQIRSASSFLLRADFDLVDVYGDSSLLPLSVDKYFGTMQGLKELSFTSVGLMAGFIGTKVVKRDFYITPSLFVGPGYNIKYYGAKNGDVYHNNFSMKVNARLGAGHNTNKYIYGFFLEADANIMPEKDIQFKSTFLILNVFCGRRF